MRCAAFPRRRSSRPPDLPRSATDPSGGAEVVQLLCGWRARCPATERVSSRGAEVWTRAGGGARRGGTFR
jgi:hypothetical protein